LKAFTVQGWENQPAVMNVKQNKYVNSIAPRIIDVFI